jgi:hypothetical protein
MDTTTWQDLMDRVVAQVTGPAGGTAPGAGTTGADPLGIRYINMGPLALVLNEAVDATINAGSDRDVLLDQIADTGDETVTRADVDAALDGSEHCPSIQLIQSFADALAIDAQVILDAAERGGCTNYGGVGDTPPGY